MKKIYITIALVLTGLMAVAQTSVWYGGRQVWTRGTGTQDNPFLLESADHLAYLAYVVNKGYDTRGLYFRLTTDVDLNGSEDQQWVPIGLRNRYFNEDGCDRGTTGNATTIFRGHFDGDGHSISNIYVDNSENNYGYYAGLFGYVEGEGYGQEVYPAVVENVYVVSGFVKGYYCGGIVAVGGNSYTALISRCWNGATIESTTATANSGAGGIVGWGAYQVKNCYNVGTINGYVAGGIVGGGSATIEECYNDGDVSGTFVGGIFGFTLTGKDTINNCYNTGNIIADGTAPTGLSVSAGGIAGMKYQGNIVITNCFNVGSVSSTGLSGCILAYGTNPVSPANNYYINTCTGGDEGEPLSVDYMRSQAFVDQLNSGNRNDVWGMDVYNINDGFPILVEDCLSAGELPQKTIKVYPNPSQGQFTVEGTGRMRVMNLLGQTILDRKIDGQTTVELPKGMYFIRIGNATQKVVVE